MDMCHGPQTSHVRHDGYLRVPSPQLEAQTRAIAPEMSLLGICRLSKTRAIRPTDIASLLAANGEMPR
jgi:hypothetical protein